MVTDEKRWKLLLKTQVQTMPLAECNSTISALNVLMNLASFRGGVAEGQYCARETSERNDTCNGYSGSPLQIFADEQHNIATVIGISSFGVGCDSAQPTLYTRIAYHLDWIESIVWPTKSTMK